MGATALGKKSANGMGGIRRRKDGRYEARYTVQTATGAKRKTIYGKDHDEVADKLVEALANRNKGLIFDAGNMTTGDYLDRWLTDSVKGSVKRRTFESYLSVVRRHLKPGIGRVKLAALTPAHVQGLYREKLDSGLSPTTVEHIHTTLHRALKQAVRFGLVPRNVSDAVDVPKRVSAEIRPLTPKQAKTLLRVVKGDSLEALYTLALTTGMRQGELLGLRWSDVDLDRAVLRISQTLVTGWGKQTFEKPKTAKSRRSVSLTARAVESLKRHRDQQQAAGLFAGDGLVFTNRVGNPLHPKNLVDRYFKPTLKAAGLPAIRFHDLRHTAATLLLSADVHPKVVQEMLGHANISITLDTYSHLLPGMMAPAVDAMEDTLGDEGPAGE